MVYLKETSAGCVKAASKRWSEMTQDEKLPYLEQAENDKLRFDRQWNEL